MSTAPTSAPSELPAIRMDLPEVRAEHDALAAQLATRRSIDRVRRAAYLGFAGFIGVLLTAKLGWDRYAWRRTPAQIEYLRTHPLKGPPFFMWLAMAAAVVLLGLTIRELVAARRLMREEDALLDRFRALRRTLGFEG